MLTHPGDMYAVLYSTDAGDAGVWHEEWSCARHHSDDVDNIPRGVHVLDRDLRLEHLCVECSHRYIALVRSNVNQVFSTSVERSVTLFATYAGLLYTTPTAAGDVCATITARQFGIHSFDLVAEKFFHSRLFAPDGIPTELVEFDRLQLRSTIPTEGVVWTASTVPESLAAWFVRLHRLVAPPAEQWSVIASDVTHDDPCDVVRTAVMLQDRYRERVPLGDLIAEASLLPTIAGRVR